METENSYRKLSDFPKFDENPFISKEELKKSFKENGTEVFQVGIRRRKYNTTNVAHAQFILDNEMKDSDQFLKLFTKGSLRLSKLSKCGINIFSHLEELLHYNQTEVQIFEKDMVQRCGWNTKKNFYLGMASVVKNEFLACSKSPNKYFINPTMIFKGDRKSIINSNKGIEKK